jgi:hypothetical protein
MQLGFAAQISSNSNTKEDPMKFVSLLLSSLLLVACGGGGGGGATAPAGPVASTLGFPLKAIYKNSFLDAVTNSYGLTGSLTITGAGSGVVTVNGSGTQAYSPVSAATFETKPGFQRTLTQSSIWTLTGPGGSSTVPISQIQTTYVDVNYVLTGYSSATSYTIPSGAVTIPDTAKVGESGTVANLNSYTSSAKTTLTNTHVLTWALKADTATTAIAELTQVTFTSGIPNTTVVQRFRITPDGSQTRLNAVETVSNLSLGSGLFATGSITYTY